MRADLMKGVQKWELLWTAWLMERKAMTEEMKLQCEGVAGASKGGKIE